MEKDERDRRAQIFNSLLIEYDRLTEQVADINSKINLSPEDEKKVTELKTKMAKIMRDAQNLGDYHS